MQAVGKKTAFIKRWLLIAILLNSFVGKNRVLADEIHWQAAARDLNLDGWRARLTLDPAGNGWLGGSRAENRSQDLLWRLSNQQLEPRSLPSSFTRAYVLDLDSSGTLWVAAYDPTESTTQKHLEVIRLPRDTAQAMDSPPWTFEEVRPGLWPQAIEMTGPTTGWIGGNHAKMLERTPRGWQEAEIQLEPGVNPRDLNVLDIAIPQDGRGGMLVGSRGLVARLENGVWRQLPIPEEINGRQFFALDLTLDGKAWIVGLGGVIARWHLEEGWHIEHPTSYSLMAIDMVSNREGWAVGQAGTILHLRDGHWQNVASPVAQDLFDIAMQDREQGWIIGQRIVLHGHTELARPSLIENTPVLLASRSAQELAAADLNGDGTLDLILGEREEVRVFPRGPDGFNVGPVLPRPISSYTGRLDGWAVGDGDGDGAVDLLLLGEQGAERHFYRNDGTGTFTDTTSAAALGAFEGRENSAYWVDLDTDGDLDLYIARGSLSGSLPLPDQLYANDGSGRFAAHQLAVGDVTVERAVIWGDLDGDGDPDAVIPGFYPFEARLYRNEEGKLIDSTQASELRVMTSEVNAGLTLDLDLDGDLDLVLVGQQLEIHHNQGFGQGGGFRLVDRFLPPLDNARAIFCRAGDFDLDGLPELLVHWRGIDDTSTLLLTQLPDGSYGKFESHPPRSTTETSDLLASFGPLTDAVLADLDGDGDLDPLLTGPGGTILLEGQHNDHRWLRVRLHGHRGSTVGTSVRVYLAATSNGSGRLLAHVQTNSDDGKIGEIHTGLGDAFAVDVEVLFPPPYSRRVLLHNIAPGSMLDVHDTAIPGRLLVRALRVTKRLVVAPRFRRGALVFALGLALALATSRILAQRRRSGHFCGPYRLGPVLGEGAMGTVHRARHMVRRHDVALKLLHPHLLHDETHRLRFLREARLMAEVKHPSLVQIEEAGEIDGRGFIAMELLEGRSLASYLKTYGTLPTSSWRVVASALGEALSALHERGIVHRDLKSENVFVLDSPADHWTQRVRLMDLGLARNEAQAPLHQAPHIVGTVATMAPECLEGALADTRADLWSLGVVLYEAATGRLPFAATDGAALVYAILNEDPIPPNRQGAKLPASDEALILALLARDPTTRPKSAKAVATAYAVGSSSKPHPSQLRFPASSLGSAELTVAPLPVSSSTTEPWFTLYASAADHLKAGRLSEADIAIVACLQIVRSQVAQLTAERQAAFLARPDIRSVLELSRRLERNLGKTDANHSPRGAQ